jgi:integrase
MPTNLPKWLVGDWNRVTRDPLDLVATNGKACTPQDLRHSWVTHLRAAGIDPADLAEVAGHTVETATARYTHALGRSDDAIRQVLG